MLKRPSDFSSSLIHGRASDVERVLSSGVVDERLMGKALAHRLMRVSSKMWNGKGESRRTVLRDEPEKALLILSHSPSFDGIDIAGSPSPLASALCCYKWCKDEERESWAWVIVGLASLEPKWALSKAYQPPFVDLQASGARSCLNELYTETCASPVGLRRILGTAFASFFSMLSFAEIEPLVRLLFSEHGRVTGAMPSIMHEMSPLQFMPVEMLKEILVQFDNSGFMTEPSYVFLQGVRMSKEMTVDWLTDELKAWSSAGMAWRFMRNLILLAGGSAFKESALESVEELFRSGRYTVDDQAKMVGGKLIGSGDLWFDCIEEMLKNATYPSIWIDELKNGDFFKNRIYDGWRDDKALKVKSLLEKTVFSDCGSCGRTRTGL